MTGANRPDMMWPFVVEFRAATMIGDQRAEVSVPLTMELLTDAAGPLASYLKAEINRAFEKLDQQK